MLILFIIFDILNNFLFLSIQYLGFGAVKGKKDGRRAASQSDVKSSKESSDAAKDNEEKDAMLKQVSGVKSGLVKCASIYGSFHR